MNNWSKPKPADDVTPEDDEDVARRDPNDPGEVPTRFTTVGLGWSGRDEDDDRES